MNNLANDVALLGRYDEAVAADAARRWSSRSPCTAQPTRPRSTASTAWARWRIHGAIRAGRITASAGAGRPHPCPRSRVIERTIEFQGTSGQHPDESGPLRGSRAPRGDCRWAGPESLGPRHVSTLYPQDTPAAALLGLGRADEAEATLRRVLGILDDKKAQGEDIGEGDELSAYGAAAHGDGAGGAGTSRRG